MNSLTRRRFLAASGVTVTLAAGAALGLRELIDRTRTKPLPSDAHVLVVLTLYGGNDGLGTVIPAPTRPTSGPAQIWPTPNTRYCHWATDLGSTRV
jgi:uncharacterized protein (DUF1501 family)